MPLLRHRDDDDQGLARATQADPWVMYLVACTDRPADRTALVLEAARATMLCVAAYAETPVWSGAFEAWSTRSFRKVTLRARGSAWTKLTALDAAFAPTREAPLVCALPPRLRSESGSLLRSLQVFQPDPASLLPSPALTPPAPDPSAPSMAFVLNPAATMSVGKQMAQVAHAVLMCAWSDWSRAPRYTAAFAAWTAAGYPCHLLPSSQWADLHANADGVVVRDAGLTEVDPGTETVIALPPA